MHIPYQLLRCCPTTNQRDRRGPVSSSNFSNSGGGCHRNCCRDDRLADHRAANGRTAKTPCIWRQQAGMPHSFCQYPVKKPTLLFQPSTGTFRQTRARAINGIKIYFRCHFICHFIVRLCIIVCSGVCLCMVPGIGRHGIRRNRRRLLKLFY